MSALSGIDIALWDLKGEQPPKIVAIADTAADIKQQDECMCPCMSSWEGLCGSDVKCMPYASSAMDLFPDSQQILLDRRRSTERCGSGSVS